MLIDFLMIFMIIVFICFFLTIFIIDISPVTCLPIIMIGMITSIIVTYGLWKVERVDTVFNATSGATESFTTTFNYGDPYSYIFFLIFWIFVSFFLIAIFMQWKNISEREG
jgi:hypothetical protein